MLKWIEIASEPCKERYTLLEKFLEKAGVPNKVHFVESSMDNFASELENAKKNFDQILIGPPFTEMAFDPKADLPAHMLTIKSADCIFKSKENRWWPDSILYEAFTHCVANNLGTLDINSAALVVGAGGAARAVLSSLLRMGFNKFNIADRFEERGRVVINDLKRNYFNVKFDFVPQVALTSLPGMHSVLVNATPLTPENDLLKDLQFLNFIKEKAAVIDLVLKPSITPLLVEADHIGAKIINGADIAAKIDALWALKVAHVKIDHDSYLKELTALMV